MLTDDYTVLKDHPWGQAIKWLADNPKTYGLPAERSYLAYLIYQDEKYGRLAAEQAAQWFARRNVPDNDYRQQSAFQAYVLGRTVHFLSEEERATAIANIKLHADIAIKELARVGDSDLTTGVYLFLGMCDVGFGLPYMKGHAQDTWGNKVRPMGGFEKTGDDFSTVRNTLAQYVKRSEGGIYFTGSQYGPNDFALGMFLPFFFGDYNFPEYIELARQYAEAAPWMYWPDGKPIEWNDDDSPEREIVDYSLTAFAAAYVFTEHTHAMQAIRKVVGGSDPKKFLQLGHRALLIGFDPRLLDPLPKPKGLFVAKGTGHVRWSNGEDMVAVHLPTDPGLDHAVRYEFDIRTYRKGKQALSRPVFYGAGILNPPMNNAWAAWGLGEWASLGEIEAEVVEGVFRASRKVGGPARPRPYAAKPWSIEILNSAVYKDGILSVRFKGYVPDLPDDVWRQKNQEIAAAKNRFVACLHTQTVPEQVDVFTWQWDTPAGKLRVVLFGYENVTSSEIPEMKGVPPAQTKGCKLTMYTDSPNIDVGYDAKIV